MLFEKVNDRWEIAVTISDGQFQQVSFVNSICTFKGGQHVSYIADQITAAVTTLANKKNKGVEIKPHHVKNHLSVFVNCLIENPAFDSQVRYCTSCIRVFASRCCEVQLAVAMVKPVTRSVRNALLQTKETLTTRPKSFGSTAVLAEKFIKSVSNSGLLDRVLAWARFKQTTDLKKKGGSKKAVLMGIPKLDDANFAGTAKADKCTLILTEGDSAKSLAISGLSVVGRDFYGVFPLKGKLLNVREASHSQMMGNTVRTAVFLFHLHL